MKIIIENQTYELRFGFGAFRIFGVKRNVDNYDETLRLIMSAMSNIKSLTFDQEDIIKELVMSAAEFAKDPNFEDIENVSFLDYIFNNQEEFQKIATGIENAFPSEKVGKPAANPTVRKSPKKKK